MLAARSRQGRSTKRGEASREQLLDSAIELLREGGYAGLSISGLCKRAGISPTSVYWHFGSKAGLMEAVLRRVGRVHTERIRDSAAGAEGQPLERLDRMLGEIRELVLSQPLGSLTSVALLSEGRHVTPDLREALREARQEELNLYAADFEAELGGRDPGGEALAVLSVACSNYAALQYRLGQDSQEVDRVLDALRRVMLFVASASRPRQAKG